MMEELTKPTHIAKWNQYVIYSTSYHIGSFQFHDTSYPNLFAISHELQLIIARYKTNIHRPMSDNNKWSLQPDGEICIVGSGISGLATAKRLLSSGYRNIIVYERRECLGGVWHHPYPGLHTQNPIVFYEFPDYPFTLLKENETKYNFVDGYRYNKYLNNYAKDNHIIQKIKFNHEVVLCEYNKKVPNGK
eukprot:529439_1